MNAPALESLPQFVCRLDPKRLQPGVRHYNPSLCEHAGRLLLAYRVQDVHGASRVAIARLHRRLHVLSDVALEIPDAACAWVEDPRLCVVNGKLVLLVVQIEAAGPTRSVVATPGLSLSVAPATAGAAPEGFRQRAFRLDPESLQPIEEIALPFGHNGRGKHEKNWIPFERPGGGLGLVYSLRPHVVIDVFVSARLSMKHSTPGIERWRWGTVSGRTPAVRLDAERYLAIIGGHVPHHARNSLYWVGAYTFSAAAPHEILAVSREPFLWGSEQSPALLNPRAPHWNPLCVFPGGLVLQAGKILLSVGTNDSFIDFLRYDLLEILGGMVPPSELTGEERLVAPAAAPARAGNQVRVRVVSRKPVGEPGGPFFTGDEFFTDAQRAAALGPQKVQLV